MRTKIFLSVLSLLLLIALGPFNHAKVEAAVSSFFIYEISENGVKIVGTDIKRVDYIPDVIEDQPVVVLSRRAFFACTNSIKSITIPANVIDIEDECFLGVIGDGYVDYFIPSTVESIGIYALGYTCYENYQEGCIVQDKIEKLSGVKIHGYSNTAAETYANENGFTFIALDDQITPTIPVTTTTETATTTDTTTTESTTLETAYITTTSTNNLTEIIDATSNLEAETTTTAATTASTDNVTEVTDTNSTSETETTTIAITAVSTDNATEVTNTISTSETTTPTTVATNYKNITAEDFINWAKNDYQSKTGITPANAVLSETPDGCYEISLVDDTGNVLDIYIVDPVTATGTNQNSEEVNLPQTGYSNWYHTAVALAACVTVIGGVMVIGFGVLKKKR